MSTALVILADKSSYMCVRMYMCVGVVIHMYCALMCDGPQFLAGRRQFFSPKVHLTSLFLLSTVEAVLAELRRADLISSEECEGLQHISGVVVVQKDKSPEVMSKTAEVLRRHGFDEESAHLAGRQSRPSSICLCYFVQWSLLMTATLLHPLLSTDRCS